MYLGSDEGTGKENRLKEKYWDSTFFLASVSSGSDQLILSQHT